MSKKLIATLILTFFILCGCTAQTGLKTEIVGSDDKVTSRMENIAQLQKNLFTATILDIKTENALITKYNLDLTTYTVYTVDITQSIDGFSPLGTAKLYCVGTAQEFQSRINLKKGEKYIIDAQPWVYGDEVVYLLSIYTVAYPRIDAAGMVTLAQSESEAISCGTLEQYLEQYNIAKNNIEQRQPGFFSAQNIFSRFEQTLKEIKEKNSDTSIYTNSDMGYAWTPDTAFIEKTAKASQDIYQKFADAPKPEGITTTQAYELIGSILK